jgi:hypothetical protein
VAGRREARARGVELEWVQADAESLPFGDGEFDVVASSVGAIFAPDHQAVADELVSPARRERHDRSAYASSPIVEPGAGVEREHARVEVERRVADGQQLRAAEPRHGRIGEPLVVAVAGQQRRCFAARPRFVAPLDHQQLAYARRDVVRALRRRGQPPP